MYRRLSAPFYLTVGWISTIVSLVILPYIFGIIGLICGIMTYRLPDHHKTSGIILSICAVVFAVIDYVLVKIII